MQDVATVSVLATVGANDATAPAISRSLAATLGQWPQPSLVAAAILAAVLALLLALVTMILFLRRNRNTAGERLRRLEARLAELSGQLRQQADTATARDTHIARLLAERLDAVSVKLGEGLHEQAERTASQLQTLAERLAVLDEARGAIGRLAGEVADLQRILSDKQARGAFGQARMEAIVRDALPAGLYAFQPTLSTGVRPDCVIRLPDSDVVLAIDAKFPLEAFEAFHHAATAEDRRRARRRIETDVKRHVRDIAGKYLIPGETHDIAIMFVPAESLYAELHAEHPGLVAFAHEARVVLASPNTLMLLVQTLHGLHRDVRLREAAARIRREVGTLVAEADALAGHAAALQKHFAGAQLELDAIEAGTRRLRRLAGRLQEGETDPNGR